MSDVYKWLSNKNNVRIIELEYGGQKIDAILQNMQSSNIHLNEHAKILMESDYFKTSDDINKVKIVELTLKDLEIENNAALPKIIKRGLEIGLLLCPLEIAPYYRLKYLEQKEEISGQKYNSLSTGNPVSIKNTNKAPKGSVTIISEIYKENNDSFPKGFYIIKKDNELWLRGYICSMDYVWDSSDKLAFIL